MKKRSRRRGGFTLLELIIAITILSLITLIIGSGFRIGIRAWEKGDKETGEIQRFRVLSSMLSQQIRSAHPYKMKFEDRDEPAVLFTGESHSLMFVTTLTDQSYGGFKWVKYLFREGNLLYKEGLLPDKKLEEKIMDSEEIIDANIDDIGFAYLSDDGEWKDAWDYGENLPRAVKVRISYFQPFVIYLPLGVGEKEGGNNADTGQT